MRALSRDPASRGALAEDPDLAASAVEELLRVDPPVQLTQRTTVGPVELGGRRIPGGSVVILLIAAANRTRGRSPIRTGSSWPARPTRT